MRLATSALTLALITFAGCKSGTDDVKLSRGQTEKTKAMQKAEAEEKGKVPLAIDDLNARAATPLTITSAGFASMKPIPATYSDYGEKSSPPLKIEGVPKTAKSIVVIVDDPDAMEPKPFIHWVLYNLPATTTELRTAVPATGQVRQLMNAKQGLTSAGTIGYFGPKPPPNDPPHHYHFQVFALDMMLPLEQGAKKSDVINAAKGHVVAAGELVGTFQKVMPK